MTETDFAKSDIFFMYHYFTRSDPTGFSFLSLFFFQDDGKVDIQEFKDGWSHADFALQSDAVSLFYEVDHNNDGFIQGAADYDRLFSLYDDNGIVQNILKSLNSF